MSTTTTPQETKKRLALAIIDFLTTSLTDGTLHRDDDRESIDVAISCIADTFKVDATSNPTASDALGSGQNLLSIYSVYEKLRGKTSATAPKPSSSSSTSAAAAAPDAPSTTTPPPPSSSQTKNPEAETLKGQGNAAMQSKDYPSAISYYSRAIALQPTNAIYLSNRAAAYSATLQHELAKQDAELATAADPKYTKAWSRLGLARFALGDARGSMEAYRSGIEAEGNGGSEAMRKGFETAKRRVEEGGDGMEEDADDAVEEGQRSAGGGGAGGMPDLAGLASMLGGGGAGGGMPDLGSLMNNPMMRQMASSMMQNPEMLNNLMSNPALRNMASQFGGGGGGGGEGGAGRGAGGMPDLSALMQDPSIAEMARNLMGGGGAGAGAGAGAGRGAGS